MVFRNTTKSHKNYFQTSTGTFVVFLDTLDIQCPMIKFIYSEKATKCCKISTVDLSYVVPVKSMVEILPNVEAFSEYMNFKLYEPYA